jgi:hypothetical protein
LHIAGYPLHVQETETDLLAKMQVMYFFDLMKVITIALICAVNDSTLVAIGLKSYTFVLNSQVNKLKSH